MAAISRRQRIGVNLKKARNRQNSFPIGTSTLPQAVLRFLLLSSPQILAMSRENQRNVKLKA